MRCFWAGEKSGETLFHDDEFAWNFGMEDRWERNDFEELVAKTFVVRAQWGDSSAEGAEPDGVAAGVAREIFGL